MVRILNWPLIIEVLHTEYDIWLVFALDLSSNFGNGLL